MMQRPFAGVVVTLVMVLSAFGDESSPDAIVPESDFISGLLGVPPSGSGAGSGAAAHHPKGYVKYGPGMVDGTIDDNSDYHSDEVNSDGYNKLVGPGKTSDMKGAHVQSPGYTPDDAILGRKGHYYLGPSRRRIGAGFGRRRRSPLGKTTGYTEHKTASQIVKQLEGKKVVKKESSKGPPPPPVPEMMKPVKQQLRDATTKKVAKSKLPKGAIPPKETKDLDKDKVLKATKTAVKAVQAATKAKATKKASRPQLVGAIGCFKDKNGKGRDLPVRFGKSKVSWAQCKKGCANYKYFGRQYNEECWCGNTYGKYGRVTGCLCDAAMIGSWKNCVYPTHKKETVVPYVLKVRVTTGKEKYAQSGDKPEVVFTDWLGKSFKGTITSAGQGKTKETTFHPPKTLGKITGVRLIAKSKDGWLLTKLEVKSGTRAWQSFGCLPQWLDGKPYDKKSSYGTTPYGNDLKLKAKVCTPPAGYTLQVSVTTGKEKYAQSGDKPEVVITDWLGKTFKGTITSAGQGKTKVTTFHPPKTLGKITGVRLIAKSKDGWLLTKLKVKSGTRAWQSFGCLPQWLDGQPYDSKSSYGTTPYGDDLKLKAKVCTPPEPYKLKISVTTGKEKYAQSGDKPEVVFTDWLGKVFKGTITSAGQGKTKETTFHPPKKMGKIIGVRLIAKSRDGWLLTKLKVKSGTRAWQTFGKLPQWLDGKPYDKKSSYGTTPYGNDLKLKSK
jgi:hypothetical protein